MSPHVLQSFLPTPIKGWRDWKTCFEGEVRLSARLGYLHGIFDPQVECQSEKEEAERVCYLLDLADGWDHRDGFYAPDENPMNMPGWILNARQKLSRTALDVLCKHVFQNKSEKYRAPSWAQHVIRPTVLDKLFWFFRREEGRPSNLQPGSKEAPAPLITGFAYALCDFSWRFVEYRNREGRNAFCTEQAWNTFRAYQPQFVQLLSRLGRVDILRDSSRYPLSFRGLLALADETMSYQLGSTNDHLSSIVRDNRLPRNLDEAVASGLPSAEVLNYLMKRRNLENWEKQQLRQAQRRRKLEAELAKLKK